MRSYEAARSLYSFLGFLAWCAIVGGFVITIAGGDAANGVRRFGQAANGLAIFMGMVPGLVMMFMGFIALAIVQNGRATVDTAEYTQQMLEISRSQLEVSQQSLRQLNSAPQSFAAVSTKASGNSTGGYAVSDAAAPDTATSSVARPAATSNGARQRYGVGDFLSYKNATIRVVKDGFLLDQTTFPTLDEAKAKVDAELSTVQLKSSEPGRKEPPLSVKPDSVTTYQGYEIIKKRGTYTVSGQPFMTLAAAKDFVDRKVEKGGA